MRTSRFSEEQIACALRQVESGVQATEVCRTMGVSEQTFYIWKRRFGTSQPNARWRMDFVADSLTDGRRMRTLTVVDVLTRECLSTDIDMSLNARKVVAILQRIRQHRALPTFITVDNGSEFISKQMDDWAYQAGVALGFIRPGQPVENCYIESFNGRLRDECLNINVFTSLEDARRKLLEWKIDYNDQRPHGSLGDLTPTELAKRHRQS